MVVDYNVLTFWDSIQSCIIYKTSMLSTIWMLVILSDIMISLYAIVYRRMLTLSVVLTLLLFVDC